jgi:hypothetical protein
MKKKRCKICHRWFKPYVSHNIYCSTKCRKEQSNIIRILPPLKKQRCKHCHCWFKPISITNKYCSSKCLKQHCERRGPFKKKRCKVCHTWFQPYKQSEIYCSLECYKLEQLRLKKITYYNGDYKKVEYKKVEYKKKRCRLCGKWFQPKRKTKQYCSTYCREIATSRKQISKKKQQAIKYKGGKCKRCGYNKYSSALEFHHRNPKLKGKTSRDNNGSIRINTTWSKLKKELDKCDLLCANCHREVHAKRNKKC